MIPNQQRMLYVYLYPPCFNERGGIIPPRFGLKDDSDDRWVKFKREIERLNTSAPSGTQYKVVFLGRHGEGYHNVAMEKYTAKAWMSYWMRLNGDGELVWGPDPDLTELGVEQAKDAHRAWKTELEYSIPLPEKLYCSPLRRAIKTNQITFEGLLRPDLKATIVEDIREKNGVSTCDKRRKMSEIAKDFPDYPFEEGFTEADERWDPEVRETPEELDTRAKKALDMIFDNDEEQCMSVTFSGVAHGRMTILVISITAHHGFINAFRRVCEHRPWTLPTGGEYL
ncbi:histidine phosphatase superfamily [Butyriboletus roseoflavus]|nr:histidine phosphatase superfamily [Butyriboletus roseoflavus]